MSNGDPALPYAVVVVSWLVRNPEKSRRRPEGMKNIPSTVTNELSMRIEPLIQNQGSLDRDGTSRGATESAMPRTRTVINRPPPSSAMVSPDEYTGAKNENNAAAIARMTAAMLNILGALRVEISVTQSG
jgi:hypothetical protein